MFCTKCGRPLEEGQVCECQKAQQPTQNQQNPFSETGEKVKEVLVNIDKEKVGNLWIDFKNKVGIGEPETNATSAYEQGMKIVPECLSANDGEVAIKQYTVAKLRSIHKLHWAEGHLQVTNKRVIFRAPGRSIMGRTVFQNEFAVDEIAGIEARKEPHFGVAEFFWGILLSLLVFNLLMSFMLTTNSEVITTIFAILFAGAGAVPPFLVHKKFFLKTLSTAASVSGFTILWLVTRGNGFMMFLLVLSFILWLVSLILCALKTNLVISVKTKMASGAIEIRRSGIFGAARGEYTGFSEVFPMQDTEKAIREIGAIIKDVQDFGDGAVEKWKQD